MLCFLSITRFEYYLLPRSGGLASQVEAGLGFYLTHFADLSEGVMGLKLSERIWSECISAKYAGICLHIESGRKFRMRNCSTTNHSLPISLFSQIQTLSLQIISIGISDSISVRSVIPCSVSISASPPLCPENLLANVIHSRLISPISFLLIPPNSELGSTILPSILIGLKGCLSAGLGDDPTSLLSLRMRQSTSEVRR